MAGPAQVVAANSPHQPGFVYTAAFTPDLKVAACRREPGGGLPALPRRKPAPQQLPESQTLSSSKGDSSRGLEGVSANLCILVPASDGQTPGFAHGTGPEGHLEGKSFSHV